jgi:3'-5' exoribonuclease
LGGGATFKSIFVVLRLQAKSDKNGRTYWEAAMMDEEGTLEAKIWADAGWFDRSVEPGPSGVPPRLSPTALPGMAGKVLGVQGKVVEFNGRPQINLTCLNLLDQEKFPPARYVRKSPIPLEQLQARFDALVEVLRPELGSFVRRVFSGETLRRLRDFPAATTHHHAYAHGLLEHTVAVSEGALAYARGYAAGGGDIDVDLALAGALLHDLGKVDAYDLNPVPEMTLPGAVLDHVALGYARFVEEARKAGLPESLSLPLAHILLSHHGQREYGSPVVPATAEALVVSSADELDFRLFCWADAVRDLPKGERISAWSNSAQRRFWSGRTSDEDPAAETGE